MNSFQEKQRLSVKNDSLFKAVFGRDNEDSKKMLGDLLDSILENKETERIKTIIYKNPFNLQEMPTDKLSILDIKVELSNGELVDIEMQVDNNPFYKKRSLYYWASMYADCISIGHPYSRLKKCIVINIVDFKCTGGSGFHTKFKLMEHREHFLLHDDLEIHFIELPHFDDTKPIDEMSDIEKWTAFFKDSDNESKKSLIEELSKRKEAIRMAAEYMENANNDELIREKLLAIERYKMDQITREEIAREEGIELGIEQEKLDVARAALKEGSSVEFIAKITKLDQAIVLRIQKENR